MWSHSSVPQQLGCHSTSTSLRSLARPDSLNSESKSAGVCQTHSPQQQRLGKEEGENQEEKNHMEGRLFIMRWKAEKKQTKEGEGITWRIITSINLSIGESGGEQLTKTKRCRMRLNRRHANGMYLRLSIKDTSTA